MQPKSNQKIVLFFWVIINIAIIFCIFLVFLRVEAKTQEYIKDKKEFLLLREKINSFEERKNVFLRQEKNISLIENSFLKREKDEAETLAKLIKEMEKVAGLHKVSLETENITQPTQNAPFYIFEFNMSGEFPDVLRFLFAIENIPLGEYKLMNIEKLNIKRATSSTCQEGQECEIKALGVEGTFEVKIYSGPQGGESADNAQSK